MTREIMAARAAFPAWRALSLPHRQRLLAELRARMTDQLDDIVRVLCGQTGKPHAEALLNEIVPTLEIIKYYEKRAHKILRPEKRPKTFLFPRSRFHLEYHPRGVVVVLGPYNFPFQLTVVPVITALAAGNTVVCKVSEKTPGLSSHLASFFLASGFPEGVVQFVSGGPEAGEALVRAKPDMVFLTGATGTGKRVMALAAQDLTPLVLELGGNDAMIVFGDAPLERTVSAAVYGGFANAGQVCVSAKRVFVQRPLYETFVADVAKRTKTLTLGSGGHSDLGPLLTEEQVKQFTEILLEARGQGAVFRTDWAVQGRLVSPVVVTNVTPDMRIFKEEVFGPALSIIPFDGEEEAISLANQSTFGLNASVWTKDLTKGRRVASRLEVGSVAVNDVLKNIGNPHMPFGGVKSSGIGFYHGPEGLRAFCRPLSVMVNPGKWGEEPNWFPYNEKKVRDTRKLIHLLYAGRTLFERLKYLRNLRTKDA